MAAVSCGVSGSLGANGWFLSRVKKGKRGCSTKTCRLRSNRGPPTLPSVAPEVKDTNPKDAAAVTRIPLWLLSPIAKAHWALAQFAGFLKYGGWNWRVAGVRASVYLSAAQRHLDAYLSGEEHDPIDGTHHLANIMACCAILLDARAAGKLTDDRPPSVGIRSAYGALEALAAKLREQYADRAPRHYTIDDTVGGIDESVEESDCARGEIK